MRLKVLLKRIGYIGVAAGGTGIFALWAIPRGYALLKRDEPLAPKSVEAAELSQQIQKNLLPTRDEQLKRLRETHFDVLVIGGGATGCGVALDAQSRGLKTALVEKFDFSAGTSSRSTKLIHGGVRYLQKAIFNLDIEQYRMVKEALTERANLIEIAPHLAYPFPIMLPIYKWWQVPYYWLGIKCYDLVAGSKLLKPSYFISKSKALEWFPMLKREKLCGALVYYDGQHDDARMCVAIALTAARMGACTSNYVKVLDVIKKTDEDGNETICGARVVDRMTDKEFDVRAKCVINATGPGADFIRTMDQPQGRKICQPSSGVHVVLPDYYSPANMGLLDPATSDGRVIFFLPWQDHTMAGTTDTPCEVTDNPSPSEREIQFILKEIKNYLSPDVNVRRGDVLSSWAGIRPLVLDPSKKDTQSVARNHIIEVSESNLITISGGKWTTYRHMAEETVDRAIEVCNLAPKNGCLTKGLSLEGAEGWSPTLFIRLIQDFGLDSDVAQHLARTYGGRAFKVAKLAQLSGKRYPMVGKRLHEDFPYLEAEVIFAVREYACRTVDVMARRTRLAFLNVFAAEEALPRIIEIMAKELGWSKARQKEELEHATRFLQKEMGLHLKAEYKHENINLTKEELKASIKRFHTLDTDKKGYITVSDLRRYFKKKGEPLEEDMLHDLLDEVDGSRNGRVDIGEYLQLMSALKTGAVTSSRFAHAAEMSQDLKPIPVNRSGGGV